jgi:uncharacterized membrane protein
MGMLVRVLIGFLSVIGFLISAYFSSTYHKVVPVFHRFFPEFCRLDSSSCATLLASSESRLFGVPNFDLGLLYYCSLAISAILPEIWRQLHTVFLLGAIVTVAAGFYLSFVLVFRYHIRCTLCFTCHAINLVIFLLVLIDR